MASLRSSRRPGTRRRYTVDAFEGIEELQSEEGSDDGKRSRNHGMDSSDDDEDEFDAGAESPDEDDEMSEVDADHRLEEVTDQGSDAGELDLNDDISIAEDPDALTTASRRNAKSAGQRARKPQTQVSEEDKIHNRGLPDRLPYTADSRLLHNFGPSPQVQEQIRKATIKWANDICLPSRDVSNSTLGGFSYGDSYKLEIERDKINWRWYDVESGSVAFRQRQKFRPLTMDEAGEHLLERYTKDQAFVMGPVGEQKLFDLPVGQTFSLATAFPSNMPNRQPPRYKSGFLLNLGVRVQSLDWASNQPGFDQYLAASIAPDRIAHGEPRRASAFSPQVAHKAHIQIWHFRATSGHYVDTDVLPRLALTLCTSIGDIKKLKWCPIPAKDANRLGLLGCIGADGAVRVYDVPQLPLDSSYMLAEHAAFESKPPNTVCTCLTWISSSRIAAGCANGYVAVWDLPQSLSSPTPNPRPVLYFSVAMTYVMSIDSCYPSHPDLLLATNMAGHITLTDLTQPSPGSHMGTASSPTRQIGQPLLAWHDFSRSCLSIEDNHTVKAFPIRRLFASIKVGRFKAHCLCLATSLCHPCVLYGLANGQAVAFNPLRRITETSRDRDPLWMQMWFAHEWRRATKEEEEAAAAAERESSRARTTDDIGSSRVESTVGVIGKGGLSRISEGFKLQQMHVAPEPSGKGGSNLKDGSVFTTVYEEKSAITAVAWNPNVHVGGWAAAGMADGLVRVEDIAA